MENIIDTIENSKLESAKKRVKALKNYYIHLFIFSIFAGLYVGKTYLGLEINFWPMHYITKFVMLIWLFIIVVDGVVLFFKEQFFGTKWEQRKINEMMNENKSNQ